MKTVVIGGGFGGISVLKHLASSYVGELVLIEPRLTHLYTPWIYKSLISCYREEQDLQHVLEKCTIPFTDIFEPQSRVQILHNKAVNIDIARRVVILDSQEEVSYDKLVIASGSEVNYFGVPGISEYAHSIKTLDDIKKINKKLMDLEHGEHAHINVVIVGGGLTGLQVAGELSEWADYIKKDVRIEILDAGQAFMPKMSIEHHNKICERLDECNIDFSLQQRIKSVDTTRVYTENREYPYDLLIWSGGIVAPKWLAQIGLATDTINRLGVNIHMQASDTIYAIGDIAYSKESSTALLANAYTAISEGRYVAEHIISNGVGMKGYHMPTTAFVVPIKFRWALANVKGIVFTGIAAYLLKYAILFRYLLSLFNPIQALHYFFRMIK